MSASSRLRGGVGRGSGDLDFLDRGSDGPSPDLGDSLPLPFVMRMSNFPRALRFQV